MPDETLPLTPQQTITLWALDIDEPEVTFDCGWRRNGPCYQPATHLFQCKHCRQPGVFTCTTHTVSLSRDAIRLRLDACKTTCTTCHADGHMFDVFSLEPIGA